MIPTRDVPNPDGLVEGGGDEEVLGGVELGAHDVVVVPGEDGDAGAGLPVPDADRLVVGGREDPGVLVVEHRRADVVQMAQQVEQASLQLVIPDLRKRSENES